VRCSHAHPAGETVEVTNVDWLRAQAQTVSPAGSDGEAPAMVRLLTNNNLE